MVCTSFKQTGWDVIGSCCTIEINGYKQPLDFCYRHSTECSTRTGLCVTKRNGAKFGNEWICDLGCKCGGELGSRNWESSLNGLSAK